MRLNLTILTATAILTGCGPSASQDAPRMPKKNASTVSADNTPKSGDSIGLQQKTFVVASLRPVIEKVTLLDGAHAGLPLPGQKLEAAEESFVQSMTSSGARTQFALAGKPSTVSKVTVFFGAVEQAADTFNYDRALNTVVLKNPPEQYTPIRIGYQVVTGTASVKGAVAMLSRAPEKTAPFKINNPNCDAASGGIVIENNIMVVLCGALGPGTELTVEYSYFDSALQVYEMKDVKTPDEGIWEVLVDGKPFANFTREATKIAIPGCMAQGAYVEISFKRDRK